MQEVEVSAMSILLLGHARENSTRTTDKMLRPFANTTLFNLYCYKFRELMKNHKFSDVTMALYKDDKRLIDIAKKNGVPITYRKKASVTSSPDIDCRTLFHYLEDFDETHVAWINGCFPLLQTNTVIDIVTYFTNCKLKSLHCVKRRHNWFWDDNTKLPINVNPSVLATQLQKVLLESVHFMHIFDREYLLKHNQMFPFTKDNPYLYEVDDTIEFYDIDTEKEFDVCEVLYEKRT